MRAIRIEAELRAAIGAQPLVPARRGHPRRNGFAASFGKMLAAGNAPPEAAAAVDESVCRGNP